jgi:cell division protein FtsL
MKGSIRPQPHKRKKPSKDSGSRNPLKYTLIALGLFMPAVLAYIWLHVQQVNLSYDLARAQKQKKELTETNKKLRIQLANLKAPERIEQIALTKLGLRPAAKGQIEILK